MKNLLVITLLLIFTIGCDKKQASTKLAPEEQTARGGKPKPPPPSNIPAPTGLTVTVLNSTSASLQWNPVTNATAYWIYRDQYVPAIVNSTNYTDVSLSPGTTYTYAVAAVVNSTLGPKSNPVTISTPLQ